MAPEFCPRCGAPRMGSFRFCRSCQFDFDSEGPAVPVQAAPELGPAAQQGTPLQAVTTPQALLGAAIAWIICAVLIGYLALEQFGAAGTIDAFNKISASLGGSTTSIADLQLTAGLNALFAFLTLYFGVKLLRQPTRGFLQTSVAWAVLNTLWNGYSIANGVTNGAYLGATIAAIAAGAFSFVAWTRMASKV